jgi:outer membrane protein assembly factor BamB
MTRTIRLSSLFIAAALAACSKTTPPAEQPADGSAGDGATPEAAASPAPTGELSEFDWPQWRGPRQDGISPETGEWTEEPSQVWRVKLGEGYSAFSIVGGRAFTMYQDGRGEYVTCMSTTNGKQLWSTRIADPYINNNGNGPRATPTVEDGRVYAIGASGDAVCLEVVTGKKIWDLNVLKRFDGVNIEWGLSASPVICDDKVILVVNGSNGHSLVALDKLTGELLWGSLNDRAGYSTPLLIEFDGETQIVVVTGEALVGVAPEDGHELWRYPWITDLDVNASTPIFHNNRVFVSSGYNTGAALVELVKNSGGIEPKLVWSTNRMKNHFSSSILMDGYIYGFHNAILSCLDFETGEPTWSQRGFHKGALLGADGKLIILGERGNLALAEASPEEYREIWNVDAVRGNRNWTVPTLSNGRLYVRNEEEVVCFDLNS